MFEQVVKQGMICIPAPMTNASTQLVAGNHVGQPRL